MRIGSFALDQKTGNITGTIATALFVAQGVTFVPVRDRRPNGPAFRIYRGTGEIGAAWEQSARESGEPYHSVKLDGPGLAAPINAALFASKEKPGQFELSWNRRDPQQAQQGRTIDEEIPY